MADVLREMESIQKREAEDTAALENMVQQVEANLTETTVSLVMHAHMGDIWIYHHYSYTTSQMIIKCDRPLHEAGHPLITDKLTETL